MKTAEEIYQEIGCNSKKDIIEAMKLYANHKLDLAIENCSIQDDNWNPVITTKELENLKDEL